jgi:glucose-1-phosphate thymidylyltransferase
MVYGTALTDVAPFTNYAQSLGQISEVGPGILIQTQKRMFARRNMTQRPCDADLIAVLHERSRSQRTGLANGPLSW